MNLLSFMGLLLFFSGLLIFSVKFIAYHKKNVIDNEPSTADKPMIHMNIYRVLTIILLLSAFVIIIFSKVVKM